MISIVEVYFNAGVYRIHVYAYKGVIYQTRNQKVWCRLIFDNSVTMK